MVDFLYIVAFFVFGLLGRIAWLNRKMRRSQTDLIDEKLLRAERENELKVIKDNSGKSDSDIVGDIISRAGRKPDSD